MLKIVSTFIVLSISSALTFVLHTFDPVVKGDASVYQLQDSNVAYAGSQTVMNLYDYGYGGIWFVTLTILTAIWLSSIKKAVGGTSAPNPTGPTSHPLAALLFLLAMVPSYGYHDRVDAPEWVAIMPNQSAFLIPVVGANLTNQAEFSSKDYLEKNKVAAKRIQIPHTTVEEKTGTSSILGSVANWSVFVPASQLFIVDRTPYMRQWTAKGTTGTSNADQSFHVESSESLNITCDIVISGRVTEDNAATFFYNYGCDPIQGDPNDPAVIYTSVVHGKSLAEVMDTVVWGRVQAELAKGFGSMKLIDGLSHKTDIINAVEKNVQAAFATTGITIDYVGFASSLGEDDTVQKAINDVFVAQEKAQELTYLQPVIQVQQLQANIAVTNAWANAIPKFPDKWGGQLPLQNSSFAIIPENLAKSIGSLWEPIKPDSTPLKQP